MSTHDAAALYSQIMETIEDADPRVALRVLEECADEVRGGVILTTSNDGDDARAECLRGVLCDMRCAEQQARGVLGPPRKARQCTT